MTGEGSLSGRRDAAPEEESVTAGCLWRTGYSLRLRNEVGMLVLVMG